MQIYGVSEPGNPYCKGAINSDIDSEDQLDFSPLLCSDESLFDNESLFENESFFDKSHSSSWSYNSTRFLFVTTSGPGGSLSPPFGPLRVSYGSYGQDDISTNGVKVSKDNFAVASMTNYASGIFGIGPQHRFEIIDSNRFDNPTFDIIPIQVKQQGLISSVAYSLYLNHIHAGAGTLLFGGVDHSKYTGDLGLVPLLRFTAEDGVTLYEPASLVVTLHGLGTKDTSGNGLTLVKCSLPVDLRTASALSVLPPNLIRAIASSLDATYSNLTGVYQVPCGTTGSIELNFSGVRVEAPISNTLVPLLTIDGEVYTLGGNPQCGLGFTSSIYPDHDIYTLSG